MPTDLEQIATIRTQTIARIAEITAAPKPSYDLNGQKVSWTEYLRELQQTVRWCDEPFEFDTRAST